jgi:hypothetical protein
MKDCTKCHTPKPLADFCAHRGTKDGLACWCRACQSAASAARYRRCSDAVKAKSAAWRAANRDKHRAYSSAWGAANPARVLERVVAWSRENPESVAAAKVRWRERHPEQARECARTAATTRRALMAGATAERFDPLEVLERDGWKCHLCKRPTPKRLRGSHDPRAPELDHIVPLGAGGEHTRRNTACACRSCNVRKSARPLGQLRMFG